MGKHARMFRNVTANLGNEIVNAFNAEAARDYQDTKRLALDEVKVFNGLIKDTINYNKNSNNSHKNKINSNKHETATTINNRNKSMNSKMITNM